MESLYLALELHDDHIRYGQKNVKPFTWEPFAANTGPVYLILVTAKNECSR